MAKLRLLDPRRYEPQVLAIVGVVALLLFLASFLVEVRIIVDQPSVGDVSSQVRTFWQLAAGGATIGSFLIAVYNIWTDQPPADSPASGLEIRGRNHDIDIHLHLGREAREENRGGDGSEIELSEDARQENDDTTTEPTRD